MATEVIAAPRGADLQRWFRAFAWAVLVFTVGVIVSGDVVQATESGAGCGENWPRCDGSLIPSIGDANTAVEFTHRMATTVLSLGFVVLLVGAWKLYGRAHRVWTATLVASGFLVFEILLGAALVLFGWVDDDASWGRVIADGLHVINTFLLVGALALVAWFASGGSALRVDASRRPATLLIAAAATMLLITITGTINSLADTLALSGEVDIDDTPIAAILVSVRGIHPALAIAGGIGIFYLMVQLSDAAAGRGARLLIGVQAVIALQFLVGVLNIALLTPLETQIIHLVLADTIWVLIVLLAARILSADSETRRATDRAAV